MNGTTTEGIQPVSDFLSQKPQSDAPDTSDLNPVAKAETTLPGFPSEPKVDAPAEAADSQAAQAVGLTTQTDLDVNATNFHQNADISATSDVAAASASTSPNGVVSHDNESQLNGASDNLGNPPVVPEHDAKPSPQPPVPPSEVASSPTSTAVAPQPSTSSPPIQAKSLEIPTEISPPLEQQPISDIREAPEAVPQESETAHRIKDEKHQKDLERDPELAQALSTGSEAPVQRSLKDSTMAEDFPLQPDAGIGASDAVKTGDQMDTTLDQLPSSVPTDPITVVSQPGFQPEPIVEPTEQPPAPAPTPAVPASTDGAAPADQTMAEAPPVQQKIAREREDDTTDAEPASKRAKTETDSAEPQFKIPELPQSVQSSTAAPPVAPPAAGTDADRMTVPRIKHLVRGIQSAKKVRCSRFYKAPVDPVAMNIPTYYDIVKQPMDLATMEKKLKSDPTEYATVSAFTADIELMLTNSIRFNGPEHIVSKEGRELQERLLRDVNSLPPADFEEPSKAEKKAQKVKTEPSRSIPARRQSIPTPGAARSPPASTANQTFALTPDGVPLIRRDSNVADGRPKRAIHPPKRRDDIGGGRPKKKKFEWQLKFCREVLNELKKPKYYNYGQYFYYPVDPVALNVPSYHSIIKKPMDLQTVEAKLTANEYEKAKDFEEDVRQMFKNCFKFNIKGDLVHTAGEQFLKIFEDKWATKDDWLDDHEPQSGPPTPASESEEEEEEDEEDEDSDAERRAKLEQLQKQIEMMSKQMGELANSKKKKKSTPPVAGKKPKKSGSKKEKSSFPGLSNKKDKSKSKARPDKERFVSYAEKQYISAGISSLPDNRMSEALRIIQSNVPALKNTHETEIELDIDELPNSVLLKLLQFVKRFVPQAPPEPEPEKSFTASTVPSSKPKKNKPMSKHEQEAQIEELKGRLGRYGDQNSPEPVQSIEQGDSSGDESDSEESEEE